MPSFMSNAQLGDQAAMQQELTPYLDKWRKTVEGSFPASLPPSSLPASFASAAEPRAAAGAAPSEEPEHKPLVAMSHFESAKVGSSASGGMQQLDEFLKPAEEDGAAQEAAPASQEKTSLLQAPRMNIAILVVGTRGDVQPFVRIGKRLKDDGHRVRLGTHDQYEGFVRENGLEFYPLGGDPKKLSGYMCQSNGRLMPNMLSKEERDQIPEKMNMLEEMMLNTWPAVAMPHPEGAPDFHADAVIANPVAYGHVHVAEKLDIPVHLMFPQPWSPTGDLPHPLSILGGGCGERDFRPSGLDAMVKRAQNQATYYAIDEFLYAGMRYMTNDFRKKIGLEKIRAGEDGAHILNTHKVPFAYQWSPLLIPRPEDYGDQLEVTGTIFNEAGPEYHPPPDLEAFINKCNEENKAAVFVGFGSMMIADPQELANTIVEAARLSDTHVILQSSWSTFDLADEEAKKLVFQLGNCPHDWLFSKVTAVVHHGGAGTAAAGIRAGIPTMICPFFGDQHLWGQAFHHKGLGVEPCPIQDLTPQVLAAAFTTMRGLNQEGALMRRKCQRVGRELQQEDGVAGGVDCFYRHLPLEGLVCDASLMLRPVRDVRMARWFSPRLGLKLCPEAYDALRRALPRQDFDKCEFQRYHYGMAWGFSEPRSFSSSVRQGWMHLATRYAQAGAGLLAEPIKGVYQGGAENGIVGVLSGGVEGTISGAKQFFHHLKYSTRRAVMRPLQALCGGSESRGGRKVHADEVGFHSYLPDEELSEDQRKQWLEAFNAALALHQVWAAQAPSEGRPGDHKALPLRTVAALMLELQYASEVLDALALQYGMTIEDDAPAGAAAEDTEDRNERLRRKFQLRLSCFEAKAAIPRRRDAGNSIFDSDLPLQFEAVAALLQPHGPAPNVYGISTEELVRDVLVKGPSTS